MANIFSRVLTNTVGKIVKTPFTAVFQTRFADFFSTGSARERTLEAHRGWVYAAVTAISQEVGDIKLHLMVRTENDEPEEVFDHPVLDLLKAVNPRMTMHDLFEITQAHQELEGNAFWFLAKDGTGLIKEIWILRPDRVTIIPDEVDPVLIGQYNYRQRGGEVTKLTPDQIIHFGQFNNDGEYPFPVRGLGTVQAAARAIDTNFFAGEWNKEFFLNSARPDLILKSTAKMAPAETERLKRSWDSAFRGVEKSHRPFILQGGLEIEKFATTQKDMDFVNQLLASRDEILAIFRVPKTVLGITDASVNRATAEASNFIFARGTIKPKMQRIADRLTEILLPMFGADEHWFTFDSPVPEDRDAKRADFVAGIDKYLTRNEIRAELGLPPTKEGDSIFQPFSIQAQDSITEEVKAVKKPGPPHPVPAAKTKTKTKKAKSVKASAKYEIDRLFARKPKSKKTKKVKKVKPKVKTRRSLSFEQVEQLRPIWIKQIEVNEQLLSKKLTKFFEGQQERVFEALREGLKGLKRKEYKLKQVDDLLPDFSVEVNQVINLLSPDFTEFLRAGGQLANDTMALDTTFEPNLNSQEFIEDRLKIVGEQITDTTFEKIRPIIEQGIEENQSIEQISQALADDVFEEARGFRTDRIARTEVSEAQNFGNLEACKIAGGTRKRWVNFDPPDDHSAGCTPDPLEIPIDDSFSNEKQHPPQHPNCVCTTICIFED